LDIGSSSWGYWMLKKDGILMYPANWTRAEKAAPPSILDRHAWQWLQPQKKDINNYPMCNRGQQLGATTKIKRWVGISYLAYFRNEKTPNYIIHWRRVVTMSLLYPPRGNSARL
jgi:hypothetical protein